MPVTSTPSAGFTVGVASSLTFAHTSDSKPLYVLLSWWVASGGTDATDVIDSITYDGVALTRGGRTSVTGNTMEWWRLALPPVGTANVEIALNASRKITAGAVNLSGWPSAIADHTFDAQGDDIAPPSVTVDSRVGAEVLSWIGFNDENQDVTIPAGSTVLWNQEGMSVTPGGSTGDQRSAASITAGAAPDVTSSWAGTVTSEWFGVAALSFTEPLGRHMLVGTGHTVGGRDNLIAGRDNTVIGKDSQGHGQDATVDGDRSVLFNLDGTPRTLTGDGKFEVYADEIKLNASSVLVNGSPLSTAATKRVIGFTIVNGGNLIATGIQSGVARVPFSGTITRATIFSSDPSVTSGSIVVDVWKDTYANSPPTDADSITASAPPTLSSATKAEDSTLTGWTPAVTAGDVFRCNVDSVTDLTHVTLILEVTES